MKSYTYIYGANSPSDYAALGYRLWDSGYGFSLAVRKYEAIPEQGRRSHFPVSLASPKQVAPGGQTLVRVLNRLPHVLLHSLQASHSLQDANIEQLNKMMSWVEISRQVKRPYMKRKFFLHDYFPERYQTVCSV